MKGDGKAGGVGKEPPCEESLNADHDLDESVGGEGSSDGKKVASAA